MHPEKVRAVQGLLEIARAAVQISNERPPDDPAGGKANAVALLALERAGERLKERKEPSDVGAVEEGA